MHNISLKQLRYFLAAAENGRFSMAAAAVHVSQSAITNAVLNLEGELKVKLFERHPHGVTLTADGHSFYQRCRDIVEALDDAVREPCFQVHRMEGEIHIAASYTLLGYFLPQLMARFRTNYPAIALELHDLQREQIEQAIDDETAELGVMILSNAPRDPRFHYHSLLQSRRRLWSSLDHPLTHGATPTLDDISRYPYIQITVDEAERSTNRYFEKHHVTRQIGFRTSSMEALRGLIAHGFGVTILSDLVYRQWSLEGKKIEARALDDAVPSMEVGLIYKRGRKLSAGAQAFKEFIIHASGS